MVWGRIIWLRTQWKAKMIRSDAHGRGWLAWSDRSKSEGVGQGVPAAARGRAWLAWSDRSKSEGAGQGVNAPSPRLSVSPYQLRPVLGHRTAPSIKLGEEAIHLHQLGQLRDGRGLYSELVGEPKWGIPSPPVRPRLRAAACPGVRQDRWKRRGVKNGHCKEGRRAAGPCRHPKRETMQ